MAEGTHPVSGGMMTIPRWAAILAGVLVLLLLSAAMVSYIQGRSDLAALQATIKAKDERIDQLVKSVEVSQRTVDTLQAEMTRRDEETRRQLDRLSQLSRRSETATPQQLATEIKSLLPVAPVVNGDQVTITQQELRDLFAAGVRLKTVEVQLESATKNVAVLTAIIKEKDSQLSSKDEQLKLTGQQRDEAVKVAKGGSFLKRLGRAAKWVAVGVVVGVAVMAGRR